jgi:hypothetical protein
MALKFPKTVAACIDAEENFERAQWRIGDALVDETDEKMIGPHGMTAVVAELQAKKVKGYSARSLLAMRSTAKRYPVSRRRDLPFWAHKECANPDLLDALANRRRARRRLGELLTAGRVKRLTTERDALIALR